MRQLLLIVVSIKSAVIGVFLFLKPALAIEIQKRFYARINWRIEPISMQKELRNTKYMGLFLIMVAFATAIYMITTRKGGVIWNFFS